MFPRCTSFFLRDFAQINAIPVPRVSHFRLQLKLVEAGSYGITIAAAEAATRELVLNIDWFRKHFAGAAISREPGLSTW